MIMQKQPRDVSKDHIIVTRVSDSIGRATPKIEIFEIGTEMKKANLPDFFIVNAVRKALDYEGISDLMFLWKNEDCEKERAEIIADIQDMLDACEQDRRKEEVYIKFNDLDNISKNIRAFKDSLLQTVNERGGVAQLAALTGIPQPSLSRFFNSNSMPHRTTLLKISKALELDEIKMDLLWIK